MRPTRNTREGYRLAWTMRRSMPRWTPEDVAGSPLVFRCASCDGDIIVAETFLTKPRLCYDCLDLVALGYLVEETGTTWIWRDEP